MSSFFARKRAIPSTSLAIFNAPQAVSSPRDYKTFSEDSYKTNVVAYRCIERITDALSAIDLVLKNKSKTRSTDTEIFDHPILNLLSRPNMSQSYQGFMKSAFGYFLISGNDFIQAVGPNPGQPPTELWSLRPDRMTIRPGQFMIPAAFCYKVNSAEKIFPVDQLDGSCSIMQIKTFNPLNDWYGMSPIEAAAFSVDQYNAMGKWNLGLLQNSGRPSGALIVKNPDGEGQILTEEQRRQLREEIDSKQAGEGRAGKILLLEGGMDWKEMGFNPKDMDWIEGKHTTARDVALAFGVPPQLLGIPGDNTYSNYEQAKMAFYLDTIIPLVKFWADHLNHWLVPAFDESKAIYLEPDINAIDALEPMRAAKWTQISGATFLSYNEKREQLGYGRYEPSEDPGDKIFVPMGQVPLEMAASDESTGETDPSDAEDFEDTEGDDDGSDQDGKQSHSDNEESKDASKAGKSLVAFLEGKAVNLGSRRARERYRKEIILKRNRVAAAFEAQLKAVWKKEAIAVSAAVEGVRIDLVDFVVDAALEKTQDDITRVFKANITKIMQLFAADVLALAKCYPAHQMETKDASTRFESHLQWYVDRHVGERIKGITRTTKKRVVNDLRSAFSESLAEGATPNEMINTVKATYSGFNTSRAATIVNTETGIAQNESQRAAAKALGIPGLKKTWISEQSDRTRQMPRDSVDHYNMHEVSVGINEKFQVPSEDGADSMEGPGDPTAPADQVISCHCVTVFEKGED
jgi:HK97 family phage portal protein